MTSVLMAVCCLAFVTVFNLHCYYNDNIFEYAFGCLCKKTFAKAT